MLYHFLVPLSDTFQGFNLFRYISFRTAWGMMTALAICYALYPTFIGRMRQLKVQQIIRDDGPESHLLNKVGTPTMGGVPMILAITISVLLWARIDTPEVVMALVVLLGFGGVGFIDDWMKVTKKSSAGFSAKARLAIEFAIGLGVLSWAYGNNEIDASLAVPFLKHGTVQFEAIVADMSELGWLYVLFGAVVMVGAGNAVNFTDGLDGLAIGPVMTSAITYGILAYIAGNVKFAGYLAVPYNAGAEELTVVAFAILGAGLGFLWFNAPPAQIFMGDVGSLALGGTLGALAVLTKNELLLVVVGGIFVMEASSVIIQVVSFKLTGKRVFRMAPIHHHYEKLGWKESTIVVRFWIISILLALLALTTLKVR